MSEDGTQDKKTTLVLKILLALLVLLIIGLVVGVVINAINKNSDGDGATTENCKYEEDVYKMSLCAEGFFDEEEHRTEMFMEQYKKLIDEAVQKQNYDSAADLIINRSRFLVAHEECEEYEKSADDESFDGFDGKKLGRIYSYFVEFSQTCNNEDDTNKWSDELLKISKGELNGLGF